MSSEFKGAMIHAVQLAVAVFAAIFLEPWATETFPEVPLWAILAALAVVAAVAVEVLTQAIIGRPRVDLVWYLEQNPVPVTQIQADMPTSLVYAIHAKLTAGSWLASCAVKHLAKSDAVISVRFPSSPAKVVVDRAPRDPVDSHMRAVPNDGNGFDLELANSTKPSSLWTWADFRFETAAPGQNGLPIDTIYDCTGSGFFTWISAKVLVVKSDVNIVRFGATSANDKYGQGEHHPNAGDDVRDAR